MAANHDIDPRFAVFTGKPDATETRTSGLGTSLGEPRRQDVVGVTRVLSPRWIRTGVHARRLCKPMTEHGGTKWCIQQCMHQGKTPYIMQQNVVRLDSRHENRRMRGGTHDSSSQRDVSADTRVQGDKRGVLRP